MKITEVSYTRKVNLGNYESADLSMTAVLSDKDDATKAAEKLKAQVEIVLGLKDKIDFEQVEEIDGGTVHMKDGSKVEVTENTEFDYKEEEVEEKPVKKAAKKKVAKKKTAKKKAAKKSKDILYDRSNDQHKAELAKILNEHCEGWKTQPAKAKEVSEQLVGDAIFDGEGVLKEEFINSVVEGMNA